MATVGIARHSCSPRPSYSWAYNNIIFPVATFTRWNSVHPGPSSSNLYLTKFKVFGRNLKTLFLVGNFSVGLPLVPSCASQSAMILTITRVYKLSLLTCLFTRITERHADALLSAYSLQAPAEWCSCSFSSQQAM